MVAEKVKKSAGFDIAPYGNFSPDRTKWETYPALPRYGVQYFTLRGRIGILSESYSYAKFKDRIDAGYLFVKACFEVAAAEKGTIARMFAADDASKRTVAVRTRTIAYEAKQPILGFVEEVKDGKRIATDRPQTYTIEWIGQVKPELLVQPPYAYLIPPKYTDAIDTLRRHGITVEELREDIDLDIQAYTVTEVDTAARPFQKHKLVTVEAKRSDARRKVPAGTAVVKTGQKLGMLAAYLLEPQAEDGLTPWGFFNAGLGGTALPATLPDVEAGKEFPVLRLPATYSLTLGPLAPLPEDRIVNQPITEELLLGRGGGFTFGLQGTPVRPGDWLDAEHFLQVKEGKLWKCQARTGRVELFADPEKIKTSLKALKEVTAAVADKLSKATSFRMNPSHTAFLFDIGADLGIAYFDGKPAVKLTRDASAKQYVTFSPDGKVIAFVRGGNLCCVERRCARGKATDSRRQR